MGAVRKVGALIALVVAISLVKPVQKPPQAPIHTKPGTSFVVMSRMGGEI